MDLEREPRWSDLLRPGDVVVHLAARAHVMHDSGGDLDAVYRRVNTEPVRVLADGAAVAGVARIIFMSSAKVFGEGRPAPYTLRDPVAPADPYARSKAAAEEILRASVRDGGAPCTVLRPPFVYGPGGKGNFPRLVRLADLATRVPLPLGSVRNARSIVFVDNLVDAIHRCAIDPRAADRTFLPTDPRDVSTPELLEAIAGAQGRRARLIPFPPALLRAAAALVGRGPELARLTESLRLDGSALREQLGWQAPFTLDGALRITLGGTGRDDG
jgi:nucleoside-diphosphate-sugar epimerase